MFFIQEMRAFAEFSFDYGPVCSFDLGYNLNCQKTYYDVCRANHMLTCVSLYDVCSSQPMPKNNVAADGVAKAPPAPPGGRRSRLRLGTELLLFAVIHLWMIS